MCTSMWSRPKIKETTLQDAKLYAKERGVKLWKVFEDAINKLTEK